MRKALSVLVGLALVAGLTLALAAAAAAEPSDACGSSDPVSTNGTDTVCVKTGVINGSVSLVGDPTSNGYLVADGDSTNPDPLDGYIGIQNGQLVGCADGDFNPEGGNHVIGIPPDPADPCAPQPPA